MDVMIARFYAQATMPTNISRFHICTRIALGQSGPAAFSSSNISCAMQLTHGTTLLRDDKGAAVLPYK